MRDRLWPVHEPAYDRIAETGLMPLPSSVTFEPTIGCNLHCPMCYQNDLRAEAFRDSPTDQVIALIDRLSPTVRFVYLIGGEIFIRRDIFAILDALELQKMEFFITTNGTLLNREKIDRLSRYSGLVGLGMSLDGTEAIHDSIRGLGMYKKSMTALTMAAPLFRVGVNTVLMVENLHVAADLMRAVAEIGVREINFNYEIFCSGDDVDHTARTLRIDRRSIAMETKPSSTTAPAEADLLFVIDSVEQLGRKLGMAVSFEPAMPRQQVGNLFAGTIQEQSTVVCRDLTNLRIDPNGNVLACGFFRRSFGNVFEQPLEEIWNNEEFRAYRRLLLKSNLLPACKRCCKLRVLDQAAAARPHP
jgi:radical SAM protein with 4Fe4S-binding SPASM domain